MKRVLTAIVSFICFISTASAGYIDGHVLKSMSEAPVTENSHLQYVGYIIGVIDSDEQKMICVNEPPNELTPVLEAVRNYLASNSSELERSGNSLVISALTPSYGCKSKSKAKS
jgi:hypothetical protein